MTPGVVEVVLIRHGQPERVETILGAGGVRVAADPQLTPEGSAQADAVGHWLAAELPIDLVWASTMRRARQTGEAVAAATGAPLTLDERIAEFDLGATSYLPLEQSGEAQLRQLEVVFSTGEFGTHRFDPVAFRQRVDAGMAAALAHAREVGAARIAVACHGGVINAYLCGVLDRPYRVFVRPRYTAISRLLVYPGGSTELVSINELPHAPSSR